MSYAKTQERVKDLVQSELSMAADNWGHKFNSSHEGWAVLHEEVQECAEDLDTLTKLDGLLWEGVRKDQIATIKAHADNMLRYAQFVACEAIQSAAMAQKILNSLGD